MFPDENNTVLKKSDSHNYGLKYEAQVITLLASRLAHDRSIANFWIVASPHSVNGFDDIVAIIENNNGNKHILMLQVKHIKTKKMRLILYEKTTDSSKKRKQGGVNVVEIPLNTYLKTYKQIIENASDNIKLKDILQTMKPDKHYFGIFTNMGNSIQVEYTNGQVYEDTLSPSRIPKSSILNCVAMNGMCSRFVNVYPEGYKSFLSNLHFFVDQSNSGNICRDLQASIPKFTRSMVENLCNLIEKCMHDNNECSPLTKTLYFEKCLEVLLSQSLSASMNVENVKPMTEPIFQMWQSLYEKYKITIIDSRNVDRSQIATGLYSFYEQKIRHMYDLPNFSWRECVENCFRLNETAIEKLSTEHNITSAHLIDLLIYMWKQNQIPLVIDDKMRDCFQNAVYLLSELGRQYILIISGNKNLDIPSNINTFESAYDVAEEAFFDHIKRLQVSLQGRKAVHLEDIVGKSTDILRAIAASDILQWTYNSDKRILIGKNLVQMEKYYIERQFNICKEVRNEQYIINNLKPGLTAISNEPGMGKTTVIGSMALICKPTDYIVTYNLADCVNDLELDTSKLHRDPLDFIFERTEMLPNPLLQAVYEHHKSTKRLMLLIDSFDEILPKFTNKIKSILKKALTMVTYVLITTRTQALPELQSHFPEAINTIELKELNQKDIDEFCEDHGISKEICKTIPQNMLTIPLHLTMLRSLYTNNENDNPDISTAKVYDAFIQEKVRIYFEKVNIKDMNSQFRMGQKKIVDDHCKIALVYIFGKDTIEKQHVINERKWNEITQDFNEYKMALGILSCIDTQGEIHNQIRFVHKTFAEYLAAKWLFEGSLTEQIYSKLTNVIRSAEYKHVNKFLCELYTDHIESKLFGAEVFQTKQIKLFLESRDQWGLLPLQWTIMNVYHSSNASEKRRKLNIFEQVLLHSTIGANSHQLRVLTECFNSGVFWRDVEAAAQQFDRRYIVQFRDLLKKRKVQNLKNILDSKWFLDYVNTLLEFTPNVSSEYEIIPALHVACRLENVEILKFALHHHESRSKRATLLLYYACVMEKLNVVSFVLNYSPDPNMVFERYSSLHVACQNGNVEIVKKLLDHAAEPERLKNDLQICLHIACGGNNVNLVELLMSKNEFDLNQQIRDSSTCLHLACKNGNLDIVKILLQKNADPTLLNERKENSLHAACFGNNVDIVELLISTHNLCPNQPTSDGSTCMHLACKSGNEDIVEKLLKHKGIYTLLNANGENSMHVACRGNNVNIVKQLLKVNQQIFDSTYLHLACENGSMEIVDVLLRYKADPGMLNGQGENSLHAACRGGDVDVIRLLLKQNLDPNQRTSGGYTCLHLACEKGNAEAVEALLDHQADFQLLTQENCSTCLHLACRNGNIRIIRALLDRGANPNLLNSNKENSLHVACRHSNVNIVKLLLKHELNPNQQTSDGSTCLHLACESGNVRVVQTLLSHRAYLTTLKNGSKSALYVACDVNNIDIIKLMLSRDFDPNIRASDGSTCLHLACKNKNKEAVEVLLRHNADSKLSDDSEKNSLHVACDANNTDIVKLLLDHNINSNEKINLDQKTDLGHTCLQLACKNGNLEVVEMLLRQGAKPKLSDNQGENSLHAACRGNNINVIELLLKLDLNPNERNVNGSSCLDIARENENKAIIETLRDRYRIRGCHRSD